MGIPIHQAAPLHPCVADVRPCGSWRVGARGPASGARACLHARARTGGLRLRLPDALEQHVERRGRAHLGLQLAHLCLRGAEAQRAQHRPQLCRGDVATPVTPPPPGNTTHATRTTFRLCSRHPLRLPRGDTHGGRDCGLCARVPQQKTAEQNGEGNNQRKLAALPKNLEGLAKLLKLVGAEAAFRLAYAPASEDSK
jgi:hypothetical protein